MPSCLNICLHSERALRHPTPVKSDRSLSERCPLKNVLLAQTTSLNSSRRSWQSCRIEQDRRRINGQQGLRNMKTGCALLGRRLRRKSRAGRNVRGSWRSRSGEFCKHPADAGSPRDNGLISGLWRGRWMERGTEIEEQKELSLRPNTCWIRHDGLLVVLTSATRLKMLGIKDVSV